MAESEALGSPAGEPQAVMVEEVDDGCWRKLKMEEVDGGRWRKLMAWEEEVDGWKDCPKSQMVAGLDSQDCHHPRWRLKKVRKLEN